MLSRRERRSHRQPLRFWKGERMEYLHTHTPVKGIFSKEFDYFLPTVIFTFRFISYFLVVYMKNPTLTTPHK